MHDVAPDNASVFVTPPAAHDWHACVEEEEYLPALQGVHDEAPGEVSVSVTLPAAHARQAEEDVLPEEGLYVPAEHARQAEEDVLLVEGL